MGKALAIILLIIGSALLYVGWSAMMEVQMYSTNVIIK